MTNDECFLALPDKSTITGDIEGFLGGGGWVAHNAFMARRLPEEIYLKEPFIKKLANKYNLLVGVLFMYPHQVYNWHTDGNRRCGINMLLSESPSHCLFSRNSQLTNSDTLELQYQPKTYYVFNTDIPHMVVNLHAPRYLFSVELDGGSNSPSYDTLLKELSSG